MPHLYPVAALEIYHFHFLHVKRATNRIFLSVSLPHTEISVQTIAKDALFIMNQAGIDIIYFKTHFTRMVAALTAINKGAEVEEVMKRGWWMSWTVFECFYNRVRGHSNFIKALLGESSNNASNY